MNPIIRELEQSQMQEGRNFQIGNTVRIHLEIVEGDKKRIQLFEGVVVSKKGEGLNASVTVRKTTAGIGIEKILPVHLPSIKNIETVRQGKVRRAKLYYLRDLKGKASRVKENTETLSK
ncbi:MAG: 50S ribosomal protein L19 [Fibrobacteres bacterium]|nr:50S ribosomal protein L19 [Fibrobacterota bacterium]